MPNLPVILLYALALLALLGMGGFALVSLQEKEKRAARLSGGLAFAAGLLLAAAAAYLPQGAQWALLAGLGLAAGLGLLLFFWPSGSVARIAETPQQQYDERDILFARARLRPGSAQFQSYYAMRPQNLPGDELTRSKPGLFGAGSLFENPFLYAAPQASFELTAAMHPAVDGPLAVTRRELPAERMSEYIEALAQYFGALEVGITHLQPYHVYSHIGRGAGVYGEPVVLNHRFAIAMTFEMEHAMLGENPHPQGSMEAARQYVESSRTAVQLAAAIRQLGWEARAHIDGNYRVICPLVARDAGLGEIGRMGLLMTPFQGPRVRLSVVTTNLPLIVRKPTRNAAVLDFCAICKKCAENCPSRSIPFGEREEIDGALRWRIDSDTCFRYWNVAGTDCGRCLSVCPYSHPNNLYHNLVRAGIQHSGFFRRMALKMDDAFYGRKPRPRPAPRWTQIP